MRFEFGPSTLNNALLRSLAQKPILHSKAGLFDIARLKARELNVTSSLNKKVFNFFLKAFKELSDFPENRRGYVVEYDSV
jgi:hypothetical protein